MDSRLKLEAAQRDSASEMCLSLKTSQDAAAAPAATPAPATTPTAPSATPPPPPRTATTNSVASSRVQTLEIISQGHCDDGGVLQFGQLLQWMDIAACLSAERHAHLNAVTLVMDELSVESVAVRVGDIVRLEGVVNAAFSSSMEVGVTVHAESPGDASERPVRLLRRLTLTLPLSLSLTLILTLTLTLTLTRSAPPASSSWRSRPTARRSSWRPSCSTRSKSGTRTSSRASGAGCGRSGRSWRRRRRPR